MANWWNTYAWRQIQTNLREIDMLDIRADQVVRDLQAFKATLLMINAAGIITSYPTDQYGTVALAPWGPADALAAPRTQQPI